MGRPRPERSEWLTVMSAQDITTEKFSSVIAMVRGVANDIGKGVNKCFLWVTVTGGGTDDATFEIRPCPESNTANELEAVTTVTINSSTGDPHGQLVVVDWASVGDAFRVRAIRSGVTDTLLMTIKEKRVTEVSN